MLITIIFSILLFFLSLIFFKPRKNDVFYVLFLSIYHYSYSYIFLLFTEDKINDSSNYFKWSSTVSYSDLSYTSTDFIIFLVKILGELKLSYHAIFMIFSLISGLAIIGMFSFYSKRYFYSSNFIINKYTIFLLPGLHFWTVAVGKDALCLFAFYLICSSKIKNSFRLALGLILLMLVRYHILIFLIMAFITYTFVASKYNFLSLSKGLRRLVVIVMSVPIFIFLYQYILTNIQKYSSNGFNDFTSFIENRSDAYAETGSGVVLASQPYIVKVFALLFGGVPWISLDLLSLVAMIEGCIIFFMIFYISNKIILRKNIFVLTNGNIKILLWFILIFSLIMPLVSSNLGLMVRMRVMLYFPLMFIFFHLQRTEYS